MPPKKSKRTIEWVGGLLTLPDHLTAGIGIPPPEGLLWLGADGALLGEFSIDAGGWAAAAVETLHETIARPTVGRPHRPDRVRVESPELARVLRESQSEIEVVCAPTPEVDAVIEAMREQLSAAARPSYLCLDAGPVEVGDLCHAAADYYRAKPWKKLPSDEYTLAVDIPDLGLRDAVVSVIGQAHPVPGLILFANLADFEAHAAAATAFFAGREPKLPPHVALSYSTAARMIPELREEIDRYGWPVASRSAYPMLVVLDAELRAGPPTATHLLHVSAIARALVKALEQPDVLLAAWKGGAPYARAFVVPTAMRDVEVQLRAPYPGATPRAPAPPESPRALLDALAQVGQRHGRGRVRTHPAQAERPAEGRAIDHR